MAEKFLRRSGCKILRRNFRAKGGGEADRVLRHGKVLVFAEIKTRSDTSGRYGTPADAVDRDKQRLIFQAAAAWLRMLDDPSVPFRFDIIEVTPDPATGKLVCNWIQDAFDIPAPYFY